MHPAFQEIFEIIQKGREGKIPVKRTITSKTGKTFQRTYWVSASDVASKERSTKARALTELTDAVANQDWSKARATVDDLLYEKCEGCYHKRSETDTSIKVQEQAKNIGGIHKWDGAIEIATEEAERAQQFAAEWKKDPKAVVESMQQYEKLAKKTQKLEAVESTAARKVKKWETQAQDIWDSTNSLIDATPLQVDKFTKLVERAADYDRSIRAPVHEQLKDLYKDHRSLKAVEGLTHLRNAQAFSVLLHEVYHGYGPVRQDAYEGGGVVTEELTTEILTRSDMVEHFGVPVSWAYRNGGYQTWLKAAFDGVRKLYGVSEKKAWDLMTDAAHKLKSSSKGGHGSGVVAQHFVMQFAPTGDSELDKPRPHLTERHPTTEDWHDNSIREYRLSQLMWGMHDLWDPKVELG